MQLPKTYYPTYWAGCNPIHAVVSWCYVRHLIRAARRGERIPPIIIDGPRGGGNLLTGTHRAAANDVMMRLLHDRGTPPTLVESVQLSDLPKYVRSRIVKIIEDGSNDIEDYLPRKWGGR